MSELTSADLPTIPDELIEAGATGHLVVMVGAGASRGSGLLLWDELIARLYQSATSEVVTPSQQQALQKARPWFEDSDQKRQQLLLKASFLRQTMGDAWLSASVVAALSIDSARPTPIHTALAALQDAIFITTNYDALLEGALEEKTGVAPKFVLLRDTQQIRDLSEGQVLKLHGDLRSPDTIVLTSEDYFRVSHASGNAWKHKLQSFLQGRFKWLLVGYGYGDIDVMLAVNELRAAYDNAFKGPFWLEYRSVQTETLAQTEGLQPVWLTDYVQAVPWLEALAKAIEARKAKAPAITRYVAYADHLNEKLLADQTRAGLLFEQEKYEEARIEYSKLLTEAKELLEHDPDSRKLQRLVAVSQFNVAGCLLCQQNPAALHEFREVVPRAELLPDRGRAALVEVLAQLGDQVRARELLDAFHPDTLEGKREVEEARQILDATEGKLPLDIPAILSPVLALATARVLLNAGRLDEASRAAERAFSLVPGNALSSLISLEVIYQALARSVFDQNAQTVVEVASRGRIVKLLEEEFCALESRLIEPRLRQDLAHFRLAFAGLTEDDNQISVMRETVSPKSELSNFDAPDSEVRFLQAQRAASEGRLQDALAMFVTTGVPWMDAFRTTYLTALAGQYESALDGFLDLTRRYPGRAPLHFHAANLLARARRWSEALPHAQLAFEALPGKGQRLLFAECSSATGKRQEAESLLQPLQDSKLPRARRAIAWATDTGDLAKSLLAWQRYQEVAPNDRIAAFRVAESLHLLGRISEAADQAWHLFEKSQGQLDAETLYRCAVLQQGDRERSQVSRSRVRTIVKSLEDRCPNDPDAEKYRFYLLVFLGLPVDLRPIDYERLAEDGIITKVSVDDLAGNLQASRERQNQAHHAYHMGALPFEFLQKESRTRAATFVVRTLAVSEQAALLGMENGVHLLSVPVQARESLAELTDQRILTGELELLLLQKFGLIGRLREKLGPRGRLIIFRDVWRRIIASATELASFAQHADLDRIDQLLELLQSTRKVELVRDDKVNSDVPWALGKGLPVIDDEPIQGNDSPRPREVVRYLAEHSYITAAQQESLLKFFPVENGPHQDDRPFASALAITYGPLSAFHETETLRSLIEAVSQRLVVGPETLRSLESRRRELRLYVEAADLAGQLHRAVGTGVAEGWIEVTLDRPSVQNLPHASQPEKEHVTHAPLNEALAFRQALLNDVGARLLSADYFVASSLTEHLPLIRALEWRDTDHIASVSSRMRSVDDRILHLPELLKHLVAGPEARRLRGELLSLGFVDALVASDIVDLARLYGGLDQGYPSRALALSEWIAQTPEHCGFTQARLQLAKRYADAIWLAFTGESDNADSDDVLPKNRATALMSTLLHRAEAISSTTLELLIHFLLLFPVTAPRHSFVPSKTEDEMEVLSLASPAGELWTGLLSWTKADDSRRAAYNRALRETWRRIDRVVGSDGPTEHLAMPLLLSILANPTNLCDAPLEAPAILSGLWRVRPLTGAVTRGGDDSPKSVEDSLSALAEVSTISPSEVAFDECKLATEQMIDPVPPEAVLLRMKGDAAADFAEALASRQGIHDGLSYSLLHRIAQSPSDEVARREFADATVMAPWRLFREDPNILLQWGLRWQSVPWSRPYDIESLRQMLSEPAAPLPSDQLFDILASRLEKGGDWGDRPDRLWLAQQAAEIPGLASSLLVRARTSHPDESYADAVANALRHVDSPADHSSGRLSADLLFLRFAAAHRPIVSLSDGGIDLREVLPMRIHALLQHLVTPSLEGDKLGQAEAELLRLCGQVVRDLARWQPLQLKDGLWLTYRLFQWIAAQFEAMTPGEREAGIASLRRQAPPVEILPPNGEDLLNPFGFAPDRVDHRLATVLYAVGIMEELAKFPSETETAVMEPIRPVTSGELEALLIELASRPLTQAERVLRSKGDRPSVLHWEGPAAIPDLALLALLSLNTTTGLQKMAIERRLEWIRELPANRNDQAALISRLTALLVLSLTLNTGVLSGEERAAFEERLRNFSVDEQTNRWKWLGLTELFAAGESRLEDEVSQLLSDNLGDAALVPFALGGFLVGIVDRDPSRLVPEFERILTNAEALKLDLVPLLRGLGRLIFDRRPDVVDAAASLLRTLAERSPFKEDSRTQQILTELPVRSNETEQVGNAEDDVA
jgi:tetratricopeptide (TPR) repeat protein